MITPDYARLMAAYNSWQNASLYAAADGLDEAERRRDRGAFFGSIHATLNHLLWADRLWLHRLAGTPRPAAENIRASVDECDSWSALKSARPAMDRDLESWAAGLDAAALAGDLTWVSGAAKREITWPRGLLVVHVFNHQTHHRGQVHAMLTQAGARPEATDLPLLPGWP